MKYLKLALKLWLFGGMLLFICFIPFKGMTMKAVMTGFTISLIPAFLSLVGSKEI